jgi:hypothetical protein
VSEPARCLAFELTYRDDVFGNFDGPHARNDASGANLSYQEPCEIPTMSN